MASKKVATVNVYEIRETDDVHQTLPFERRKFYTSFGWAKFSELVQMKEALENYVKSLTEWTILSEEPIIEPCGHNLCRVYILVEKEREQK